MSNEMKDWLFDNRQEQEQLINTVKDHTGYAKNLSGYTPIYAALYGSQNYGIATPESDVDTKVWLRPAFRDLYTAAKPYSKELHYEGAMLKLRITASW